MLSAHKPTTAKSVGSTQPTIEHYARRKTFDYSTRDTGRREIMPTGSQRDSRVGKGRFDLLCPMALRRDAQLYERGAEKYNPRNWELGQPISRFLDSAMRHLCDHLEGDRTEDHLAAARWNIAGAIYVEEMIARGLLPPELDDRPDYFTGSHLASVKAANDETAAADAREAARDLADIDNGAKPDDWLPDSK